MDNEIIFFNLVRIERGREKLCKCNPPHYEVDTVNRIVSCQDCGAFSGKESKGNLSPEDDLVLYRL